MRVATRPLNATTIKKANDEFYASHPEMVVNGKRKPIMPGKSSSKLQKEWMDSYVKNGGGVKNIYPKKQVKKAQEKADDNFSDKPAVNTKQTCQEAKPKNVRKKIIQKACKNNKNCELKKVIIKCEHGRSPSDKNLLMVVPNSTAAIGDKIKCSSVIAGGCGKHPEWKVGGLWTSQKTGTAESFNAKTFIPSVKGFFSLKNVTPQKYRVSVSSCQGFQIYTILAYPPGEVSGKIDVSKMISDIYKKLKSLPIPKTEYDKWTSSWFQGHISYKGAWKEEVSSHRAFYEMECTGGFNPLVGGGIKAQVYPPNIIPSFLKKWVKAGLFVEFKIGFNVEASFIGKYWADVKQSTWNEYKGSLSGSGTGILSLELKLCSSDLAEIILAGETGITGKGEGIKSEKILLRLQITWNGIQGKVAIKALWGWVEITRSYQLVGPGDLYKKDIPLSD